MSDFKVHILGCGSAFPTIQHLPSAQVLDLGNKLYLIDCGEGLQRQMRIQRISFSRLTHVFISHFHGDHCFGLPGLISTLGLLGRKGALHIHGPIGLERFLKPILEQFCERLPFEVHLHELDASKHELIHEDRSVRVYSLPLKHRMPALGYLFANKPLENHLDKAAAEFYQVPVLEYKNILEGADFVAQDGRIIANDRLTKLGAKPLKYAYCSDTAYYPSLVPLLQGVDLLYHEATFMEEHRQRANETFHSTARDAAEIAKLAEVKQLLIGHYSGRYRNASGLLREAKEVFPNTHLADEGMTLDLNNLANSF